MLLAAAMTFGSCSDAVNDSFNGGNTESSKSYVSFAINLPTQSGTSRAAFSESSDLNDGSANEYAVKNATLILFNGNTEASATFLAAYDLPVSMTNFEDTPNQITTTSGKIVQEIKSPNGTAYALVVINNNGIFSVDKNNANITFSGETAAFNGTFSDFAKKTASSSMTANGFYMTNAPLSTVKGGTEVPTSCSIKTLVDLSGHIYETKAEAAEANADQVYVERGVAKVTLSTGNVTKVNDAVAFVAKGWALDHTNPSSYVVRSAEGFDNWYNLCSNGSSASEKYRFVGANEVKTGAGLYRTYFARDVNYDTDASSVLVKAAENSLSTSFGLDAPQYCFENTFNVANQNDNQTTRIILKATLNDGEDFYTIGGDQSTIYSKDNVIANLKAAYINVYADEIKAALKDGVTFDNNDLDLTITEAAGKVSVASVAASTNGASKIAEGKSLPTVTDALYNAVGGVEYYKGGDAYYFVRIKHFGDDLTPWHSTESPKASTSAVYPEGDNQNANYLGRYGVLRNNWYDITINSVVGFGAPTIGEVQTGSGTDDELSAYVNVQINVLSWAKRTQDAIFQ